MTAPLDLHTARLLGAPLVHGRLRGQAEDFQVWETLNFQPCGEGEHLYLRVRKRGANTAWVAEQLASLAGVHPRQVSYAGRKDRHAITEQWFSLHLPGRQDLPWASWQTEEFQVLDGCRHGRKLRPGALSGNRFQITVELFGEIDEGPLRERWERLLAEGVPNYFGPQRFGRGANNLTAAVAMFAGRRVKRQQRGLYLSAARAHLFNRVLSRRVEQSSWCCPQQGEVMMLEGSHSVFLVEQPDDALQDRLRRLDVHTSGPLWGRGEPMSRAAARDLELAVVGDWPAFRDGLEAEGLEQERRALRVVPRESHWSLQENRLTLGFWLPGGSFATAVLRELFEDESGDLALHLPTALLERLQ